MNIDPNEYARIAELIQCDTSPVGIDAKKTHVLIIHMLQQMNERITAIEQSLESIQRA